MASKSIDKRAYKWTTADGEVRTGVRWRARYRDKAGVRHERLFRLRKDAAQWLDEQTSALVTNTWVDPQLSKQTLKKYAEEWLSLRVHAPATATSYGSILKNHVYPALGDMRLEAITANDVRRLVKEWSKTAAPSTVEGRYVVLSTVFRAAVRDKSLADSPCVDIKLPKVAPKSALVPITTETVLALRDEIPDRYRNLVTVGAGTGMRRMELCGLTLDRVADDFGTIRVDRQLARTVGADGSLFAPPKTDASTRTIPVADVVLEAINDQVERFGVHESGIIFTGETGQPIRPSTLWRVWGIAAKKAKTDATPHDLRHYFASMHISAGTSIKALQAMLGHKSATETWDTYGHLLGDEDDRTRAVIQGALGNLGGKLGASGK